jgi:hypothetical protein
MIILKVNRKVGLVILNLLTPCSGVLLEKLNGFQIVKKFPPF